MADQLDVTPEDLVTHAANIDAIRERFGPVLDAMSSITQSNDAYGIICQFLPPVLAGRQDDQREITEMAQENLELLAQAVRDTAASYEDTDTALSEEIDRIEDQL